MLLEDMGRRHAGEWLQRLGELQPLGLKRGTARRLAIRRKLRRDSSRDGQRKQVVQSPRSRQIAPVLSLSAAVFLLSTTAPSEYPVTRAQRFVPSAW